MTITVKTMARYPIKGLSAEPIHSTKLQPGRGFSGDREFALALPNNTFNETHPESLPKILFLMLARQEALARLVTRYDAGSGILTIKDGGYEISENTRAPEGVLAIESFFSHFLPQEHQNQRPRLVTAPGHSFTDVGVHSNALMHAVSMINLASVRDVEERVGQRLDPRRFRANIMVEGLPPWAELDWVDREMTIGKIGFRGARLTTRCPATEVNPDTAIRDIKLPQELRRLYGHIYLGIYLHVLTAGTLSVGDMLVPPEHAQAVNGARS